MEAQPKLYSRGKMIEELDDYTPPFVSPVSILGKRKFNDAFEEQTFDNSRYGQHIATDFFNKNVGHCVIQKQSSQKDIERKEDVKSLSSEAEKEILEWCQYYRANRNLFNV
jgi:hypothetical protein